jgi:hypothetical protein
MELANITLAYSDTVYCYAPLILERYNASDVIGDWQVTVYINGKGFSTLQFEIGDNIKANDATPLGWEVTACALFIAFLIFLINGGRKVQSPKSL